MRGLVLVLFVLSMMGAQSDAAEYASMSGGELYKRFCASCHGIGGAGDGPVADSLKVEVPDLRLLARRAGGAFPRERVIRIIDAATGCSMIRLLDPAHRAFSGEAGAMESGTACEAMSASASGFDRAGHG